MTKTAKAWLSGCLPGATLIAVFVLYALSSFVFSTIAGENGGTLMIVGRIVNIILSLLGLVAMISFPIGIVFAIVFATQEESKPQPPQTPPQNT